MLNANGIILVSIYVLYKKTKQYIALYTLTLYVEYSFSPPHAKATHNTKKTKNAENRQIAGKCFEKDTTK